MDTCTCGHIFFFTLAICTCNSVQTSVQYLFCQLYTCTCIYIEKLVMVGPHVHVHTHIYMYMYIHMYMYICQALYYIRLLF